MMFDMIRVPVVKGRSRDEIEAVARDFLRKYFPKCLRTPQPVPMLKILDRVLPEYLDFSFEVEQLPDGLEGYTHFAGRTVTLSANTYARLEDEDGRGRFTAAHELGHVLLHTDELSRTTSALVSHSPQQAVVLARRSQIRPFRDPEWQADTFAASLLMPEEMVRRVASLRAPRGGLVNAVVRKFGVSQAAATKRLEKLGLTTTQPSLFG